MPLPQYVIVVGVDYSEASERALDEALLLARTRPGVHLHVANVRSEPELLPPRLGELTPPTPPLPWRYWASELQEFVTRKEAAFQVAASVSPFKHLHTHQRMGDPAHELAQLASDVEADLLVVGSHDWHRAPQRLLGSVTEAVTRLAPCPVLIVRRKAVSPTSPAIQPPCAACIAARRASDGSQLWCNQHSERDGRRRVDHQGTWRAGGLDGFT